MGPAISAQHSNLGTLLSVVWTKLRKLGLPSGKKVQRVLVEHCCDEDSNLGLRGPVHGAFVLRLTNEWKLHTPEGMERLLGALMGLVDCGMECPVLHVSLPCTPWSRWQMPNLAKLNGMRLCAPGTH